MSESDTAQHVTTNLLNFQLRHILDTSWSWFEYGQKDWTNTYS